MNTAVTRLGRVTRVLGDARELCVHLMAECLSLGIGLSLKLRQPSINVRLGSLVSYQISFRMI